MKNIINLNAVNAFLYLQQGFDKDLQQDSANELSSIIGIYGASPSCYLSLLNRSVGLTIEDIDTAIYEKRQLIRLRCMRGSMFLVSHDDAPIVFQATKTIALSAFKRLVEKSGVTEKEYNLTAEHLSALTENKCLTVNELNKTIPSEKKHVKRALNFIVALMCSQGTLVRAGIRGGWKSNLFEYTSFKNWIPSIDLNSLTSREAMMNLAHRYFDGYGPATAQDFQWWSGLSKPEADQAIKDLGKKLVGLQVQEIKGECLISQDNLEKLLSCSDNLPQNIRLLPSWDAYLMAYKGMNRQRYLSPEYYNYVYDQSGNATSAIFTDGRVGGIWDMRIEKKELHVSVSLFKDASKATGNRIKNSAQSLAKWLCIQNVYLYRSPLPAQLNVPPKNRFLAPLDGLTWKEID